MSMRPLALMAALAALAFGAAAAFAQHQHGAPSPAPATSAPAPGSTAAPKKVPLRATMEEMHHGGDGVPKGWTFSWPDGDAAKGKQVFAKLECYQCHQVPGAGFPDAKPDPTRQGPPLAGMGGMHPAEYFAESILNPNAVIVTAPGFTGPDGLSIMPDFRDSLTLAETIDLVAYIRTLTEGGHHQHHAAEPAREQAAGDYRVRVAYAAPGGQGGHQHGAMQGHMHHGGGDAAAAGHLMVFVTDTVSGQPMPYLPVSATIQAGTTPAKTVKLTPMVGEPGFHYGADVALPADTSKVTVAIGKPTIAVMGSRPPRAATSVTFEWSR